MLPDVRLVAKPKQARRQSSSSVAYSLFVRFQAYGKSLDLSRSKKIKCLKKYQLAGILFVRCLDQIQALFRPLFAPATPLPWSGVSL